MDAIAGHAASIEVVDLLTLKPMDHDAVIASVKKTGRLVVVHEAARTGGMAGEIFARVCEDAFYSLRAPMKRVTGYDVPYPLFARENAYLPDKHRIVTAIDEVLRD
jgi:pyruvate/2-oxoglutarate/acetoin dehydrogenase E1 component